MKGIPKKGTKGERVLQVLERLKRIVTGAERFNRLKTPQIFVDCFSKFGGIEALQYRESHYFESKIPYMEEWLLANITKYPKVMPCAEENLKDFISTRPLNFARGIFETRPQES